MPAEELPLSVAESRLLEVAGEFSRREVGPNAARWERERVYPRETIRAAARLGLTRIPPPAARASRPLSSMPGAMVSSAAPPTDWPAHTRSALPDDPLRIDD